MTLQDEREVKLVSALKAARKEILIFKDDAYCEHEVGICSCQYWQTLNQIDEALKPYKDVKNDK